MIKSLAELKLGETANIIGLGAFGTSLRQKLFACGLVPGAKLSVVRSAPLGDPIQVRLDGDIMLSIRKSEGRDVQVELA